MPRKTDKRKNPNPKKRQTQGKKKGREKHEGRPRQGQLPAKPKQGQLPAKPKQGQLPAKPKQGQLPAKPRQGQLPAKPRQGQLPTNPSEFSTNWRALSKQLGLLTSATRKQKSHSEKRGQNRPSSGTKRRHDETFDDGRPDIWFDDVDVEMVGGQPVPKRAKTEPPSLITGRDKGPGKVVSMDCEMVGTGPEGDFSMLARCSIVNHHGNVLYDNYVAPMDTITDYRTEHSGIRPRDLREAPDFRAVQKEVSHIIKGRVLIGHGLQNDLKVLLLSHPKKEIRDTSRYRAFRKLSKGGTPSLKKLAKEVLGIEVQKKEHDSVEDARVAMRLYQLHKREWEDSIKTRVSRRERKAAKRKKERVQDKISRLHETASRHFNVMLHSND